MTGYRIQETCSTEEMADLLGLSTRTLLNLRRQRGSPFQLGTHFRFRGTTPKAPLQWFPEATDEAFTRFQQERWTSIETMEGAA